MTILARFWSAVERVAFRDVGATGVGMTRATWAAVTLFSLLLQWQDVTRYYSDAGLIPPEVAATSLRSVYLHSILLSVGQPEAVWTLYLLLISACACAMVGLFPRLTTIVSAVLYISFLERMPLTITGAEEAMRIVGFLLCFAPRLDGFSLSRAFRQKEHFDRTKRLLPEDPQPAWIQILFYWQLTVIYLMALWYKFLGFSWIYGYAVARVVKNPYLTSYSETMLANLVVFHSAVLGWLLTLYEILWIGVLIPKSLLARISTRLAAFPLKAWLFIGGAVFHVSMIVTLVDLGTFSLAMFAFYPACFTREDFAAIRRWFNRDAATVELYYNHDDPAQRHRAFCVLLLDNLRRVRPVHRARQHALAVKQADGRTAQGKEALAVLARHLPALFPLRAVLAITEPEALP